MRGRRRNAALLKKAFFTLILLSLSWTTFFLVDSTTPPIQAQPGLPAQLYANQNQDDLHAVFLSGINEAKKSIHLTIFSLTDRRVIQALKKKSEEGVAVTIICDAKSCPDLSSRLGTKVKCHRRICPGIMHQKILVVDAEKSWIGSANLTSESLRIHGNLVQSVHSVPFSAALLEKADSLIQGKRGVPFPQNFNIGGQKVELWFLPENRAALSRLLGLIQSAKKSVRIAMFTWTHWDLAKAVIDAKQRGIKVEVALDRQSSKGASQKIAKLFKQKSVPIRFSKGNALLHHKFIYIDDGILVNGSTNWTQAAFTKNDDCFMIFHDLTKQQRETMERLWEVITADSSAE